MIASEYGLVSVKKSIHSHVRFAANIKLVQIVDLSYLLSKFQITFASIRSRN